GYVVLCSSKRLLIVGGCFIDVGRDNGRGDISELNRESLVVDRPVESRSASYGILCMNPKGRAPVRRPAAQVGAVCRSASGLKPPSGSHGNRTSRPERSKVG